MPANAPGGLCRQLFRRTVEDHRALRHADDAFAVAARGVQRVQVGDDGDAVALVDVLQRVLQRRRICRRLRTWPGAQAPAA